MSNREKLIEALKALPEWDNTGERPQPASTPAVKVFTPDAGAVWFLVDKDTSNVDDVRYFGLCDLGLGFPELGWVDEHSLLTVRGALGLLVELDEYTSNVTLGSGYEYCGQEVPSWMDK